jgi:hypothetical protein
MSLVTNTIPEIGRRLCKLALNKDEKSGDVCWSVFSIFIRALSLALGCKLLVVVIGSLIVASNAAWRS